MGRSRRRRRLRGNKSDLFGKALERYAEGPASYATAALREPTAREVATTYLAGSVSASTQCDRPAGCLGVQGVVALGHLDQGVRDALVAWRVADRTRLRDRFQRAVHDGDLPPDADPELLARYLMTTADGLAVQAAGGADRAELQQVADAALRHWP